MDYLRSDVESESVCDSFNKNGIVTIGCAVSPKGVLTKENPLSEYTQEQRDKSKGRDVLDRHYDNTNGSLYKFAEEQGLNAWEFDILKRIVRCRKKGQFLEDLEKTKRVIDLYIKEYESN